MLSLRPNPCGGTPLLESHNMPTVVAGTALVRIKASMITPSDLLNSRGSFRHAGDQFWTLGRDYAGIVEQGPHEWVGKEVYGTSGSNLSFQTDGVHAEYCLIPVDCLAEKPANLSFVQAASVGLSLTTAALALRRAVATSSDTVLVLGASGNVGSALCQLAALQGCKVLRAGRGGQMDVDLTSDPNMEAARKVTGGRGPDVIVDTTGRLEILGAALNCLGKGGRLCFISAPRKGSTEFTFDLLPIYHAQKSIIGCNSVEEEQAQTASELERFKHSFEDRALTASSEAVFEKISLKEAPAAYEAMSNGTRKKFVIVL